MAKKGVYKISGNSKPKVGEKTFFNVDEWYPSTPHSERNLTKVYWELFIKDESGNGFRTTNIKKKGINHFTFGKNAHKFIYKVEGYLHEPEGNSPMSMIVQPQKDEIKPKAKEKDILGVSLTYQDGSKISKPLSYKDQLKATAKCDGMVGESIVFNLWEDDSEKAGHHKNNQYITKSPAVKVNKYGKAEWIFSLSPTFITLANKKEDEKKQHEYYVTAEYNGRVDASGNVNVNNPEIPKPIPSPSKPKPKPKENTAKFPSSSSSPKRNSDPKGKILSAEFVNGKGEKISSAKIGNTVSIKITSKNMVGKVVMVRIYEDDNFNDDFLFGKKVKISNDIAFINNVQLTNDMYDEGKRWEVENKTQHFFIEVEHLSISTESQRIGVSLNEEPKKIENPKSPAKQEGKNAPKTNSTCLCKQYDLILGNKVDCDFRKKVVEICKNLWGEGRKIEMANNLMVIMYFETAKTFSPSKQNSRGFTGLIQFGDDAASDLGTTTSELKKMSAVKQLDYVKNFFDRSIFKGKINSLLDMYLSINYPAMIKNNKTAPNDVLYSAPSIQYHTNFSFMKENGEYDNIIAKEIINGKEIITKRGFANGSTHVWEVNEEMQDWYKNNKNEKWDGSCVNKSVESKAIQKKNAKYVIVLDPGHGVKPGNLGTQARKYKIKGDDKIYDANTLPSYVLESPSKYIIGNNDKPSGGYDSENTESNVVYDIAVKMKEKIEKFGHTVYITRSQKNTINLDDEANFKKYLGGAATKAAAINFRSKMSTTLEADYFISVHCDGWTDFSKGAHTIYSDDASKQLAIDLLDKYDITNILSKSPHKRNDLGVLGSSNKTKKKVLIELGYLTSPLDTKNIVNNKDKIATLLVNGLIKNINNDK